MRIKRVSILAASLLAAACILPASPLSGGSTTVTFDPTFVTTLTSIGFSVTTIAPATASMIGSPVTAMFPITGGDTTGTIDHSGGLTFSKGATTVSVEDFAINVPSDMVTAQVVDGSTTLKNVQLFDLSTSDVLTIDPTFGAALETYFGIANLSGATVGTASINGIAAATAAPEPASLALLGAGFLAAACLHRKRVRQ